MTRKQQVYIDSKTFRRLRLVQKLFPMRSQEPNWNLESRNASMDEIADLLLNQKITESYPEIQELERELARVEKEFAARVQQKDKAA